MYNPLNKQKLVCYQITDKCTKVLQNTLISIRNNVLIVINRVIYKKMPWLGMEPTAFGVSNQTLLISRLRWK